VNVPGLGHNGGMREERQPWSTAELQAALCGSDLGKVRHALDHIRTHWRTEFIEELAEFPDAPGGKIGDLARLAREVLSELERWFVGTGLEQELRRLEAKLLEAIEKEMPRLDTKWQEMAAALRSLEKAGSGYLKRFSAAICQIDEARKIDAQTQEAGRKNLEAVLRKLDEALIAAESARQSEAKDFAAGLSREREDRKVEYELREIEIRGLTALLHDTVAAVKDLENARQVEANRLAEAVRMAEEPRQNLDQCREKERRQLEALFRQAAGTT
jgi:hypothetical protein